MNHKNPVCVVGKGLGVACGKCERCIDSISTLRLKKPTLGLRPFNIWIYNRIQEIKDALQRQSLAGEDLNMAWVLEMQEITEMVKEK
jgi:hypothetical protein